MPIRLKMMTIAMRDAYAGAGVESSTRVTHVDPNGAVVKAA
jgi:hypothetical protein